MAALELCGVAKRYRGKVVLRDVSMQAEAGTCTGLIGSNGSGKSTLLGILAGAIGADAGTFLWGGQDLLSLPDERRALLGYVPQGTPLYEELSTLDNLRLWHGKDQLEQELEDGVLKMLGVGEFLRVRVSRLSGGMKKRLSIGCAMARHPQLLLLDEPSTALDLACKEEIIAYFRELRDNGCTLLLATHDLQEVEMCDQLFLLKDGTLAPCAYDGDAAKLAAYLR